jgi:hypothetical protein
MAPSGTHVVEFVNEQFNYRATEKLVVRPGETTPHTVSLPTETLRVAAPDGAVIFIDGQPTAGNPRDGVSVAIGSHDVSARHPDLGERRISADVKQGGLTEVAIRFD